MKNNKETCFIITLLFYYYCSYVIRIVQKKDKGTEQNSHVHAICFNIQVISIQSNNHFDFQGISLRFFI